MVNKPHTVVCLKREQDVTDIRSAWNLLFATVSFEFAGVSRNLRVMH